MSRTSALCESVGRTAASPVGSELAFVPLVFPVLVLPVPPFPPPEKIRDNRWIWSHKRKLEQYNSTWILEKKALGNVLVVKDAALKKFMEGPKENRTHRFYRLTLSISHREKVFTFFLLFGALRSWFLLRAPASLLLLLFLFELFPPLIQNTHTLSPFDHNNTQNINCLKVLHNGWLWDAKSRIIANDGKCPRLSISKYKLFYISKLLIFSISEISLIKLIGFI